jgi:hypothetical protein
VNQLTKRFCDGDSEPFEYDENYLSNHFSPPQIENEQEEELFESDDEFFESFHEPAQEEPPTLDPSAPQLTPPTILSPSHTHSPASTPSTQLSQPSTPTTPAASTSKLRPQRSTRGLKPEFLRF